MHRMLCHAAATAAALVVAACLAGPGTARAGDHWAVTDFSSAPRHSAPARSSAPRAAPRVSAPRVSPRVSTPRVSPRVSSPRVSPGPRTVSPRVTTPRVAPRVGGPGPRVGAPRVSGPRVIPAGARVGPRLGARIAGGRLILRGRPVTLVRSGPYYGFWRGRRYSFIALSAIAALTIGAIAYSAYAYVPVEQPVCAGYTDDGCVLRWQEIMTVEGELVPQCVTYCPVP